MGSCKKMNLSKLITFITRKPLLFKIIHVEKPLIVFKIKVVIPSWHFAASEALSVTNIIFDIKKRCV